MTCKSMLISTNYCELFSLDVLNTTLLRLKLTSHRSSITLAVDKVTITNSVVFSQMDCYDATIRNQDGRASTTASIILPRNTHKYFERYA